MGDRAGSPDLSLPGHVAILACPVGPVLGVEPEFSALGLYLGSGTAGSAYGAAGSLITMLIWIYYAAQIVLFGAEFTQVYAQERGRGIHPAKYAVRARRREIELPPPADGPNKKV